MKGDYSRFSFDPKKHYRAVLMQQGRLQLDSDWNEQVQIIEHRYNAFFRSMMGHSGTPKNMVMKLEQGMSSGSGAGQSPGLELLGLSSDSNTKSNKLRLTKGIYYIDGLLVENEELIYLDAPEFPGKYFYYVDAWTREVSAAEDGALIDSGVGLETTARLKTEWKIFYELVNGGILSKREKFQIGEWPDEIDSGNWWRRLSTGTLTLGALDVDFSDNRLYRVEVHNGGGTGVLFKWSTDNASVCAGVTANGEYSYKLTSCGENVLEAFKGAAWIELSAPGETGYLLDMSESGNWFDTENGVLTLSKYCPTEFMNMKEALIRRWDGVFPGTDKSNSLERELGLAVKYNAGAFYRSGDYWLILIRNGKIENWKEKEPKTPDGVEHYFAALGIVNYTSARVADSVEQLHWTFPPLTSRDFSTTLSATIGEDLTVKGNLVVEKTTTLKGALTVDSTANIAGDTTIGTIHSRVRDYPAAGLTFQITEYFPTDLTVLANTVIGDPALSANCNCKLTVHGATALKGDTTIGTPRSGGSLGSSSGSSGGTVGIENLIPPEKLTIHADTTIGSSTAKRDLTINGNIILGQVVSSIGNNYPLSQLTVNTNVYVLQRSLTVTGDTIIGSDETSSIAKLTVYGDTTIGSYPVRRDLTVYGNLTAYSKVILKGEETTIGNSPGSKLTVNANVNIMQRKLTVTGDTIIGTSEASSSLTVFGDVNINGNVTVGNSRPITVIKYTSENILVNTSYDRTFPLADYPSASFMGATDNYLKYHVDFYSNSSDGFVEFSLENISRKWYVRVKRQAIFSGSGYVVASCFIRIINRAIISFPDS